MYNHVVLCSQIIAVSGLDYRVSLLLLIKWHDICINRIFKVIVIFK